MTQATTTQRSGGRLRHVDGEVPGIRRQRRGKGFRYVDPEGKTVSGVRREWIEGLAIPPAWQKVWISPRQNAHILAYGYDQRGRKQYIYHPEWRKARDATKFERLVPLGHGLPTLRAHVRADLRAEGLPREKVVAAVVRILDLTFARVGSDSYARENDSYGISTLVRQHVTSASTKQVRFRFTGKGGKQWELQVHDPRVARVVRDCQELPGQRLFEYQDEDGDVHEVTSGDVNAYLRDVMGDGFTSKDFRTWGATTLMAAILHKSKLPETPREREAVVRAAVQEVAERLENTVAVCKKSYIHPAVPAAYLDGTLWERARGPRVDDLWPEESLTLHLLESFGP